jgi:hypothetical protein
MQIRLLPIVASFLFPILAAGEEIAAAAPDSGTPAPDASAASHVCFFKKPEIATASMEAQVFFSRGEGTAQQFVSGLDARYNQAFSIMMQGIATYYSPFTWSLPENTHSDGTLAGVKAVLALEPCRIGTFSVEAGFLAGKTDFSSARAPFAGSGSLIGVTVSFDGYLGRDYSMQNRSFSMAVFWQPPCLGKWVSFGLEGARGRNDIRYNLYYGVTQTIDGDTGGYTTSARFDADLAVYDVLLHARTNFKAIPLRGVADGGLSLLPEADFAAGYSFRDLYNAWETDFYNGESDGAWNVGGDFPVDDAWILRGYAGLTFLYEIQGGTLSLGGGYRYEKDLNSGMGETMGALLRLGYKRNW